MRLNPAKCTFGVAAGKFLRFMLTARGVETNLDKCATVLEMQNPSTLKWVQRLVGRVIELSRFTPKLAKRVHLVLRRMKKGSADKWDTDCN